MFKYDEPNEKNEVSCSAGKHRHGDSRLFLGIILIGIGAILIARNYGWLDYEFSRYLISWQMLLIVIGLFQLARRAYTPAIILIAIGTFFLIDIPDNMRENFWPALIVLVGVTFLIQRGRTHHRNPFSNMDNATSKSTDFIDETAIFGGRNISVVTDNFQGGKITAIFGGSKINLRYAKPVEGCTIDVATIFGGTKIIVPEDWNVKIEVVSIFGGFEDKRGYSVISRTGTGKIVVIKGSCIFGGGELNTLP
jgi:predicted membrane protein